LSINGHITQNDWLRTSLDKDLRDERKVRSFFSCFLVPLCSCSENLLIVVFILYSLRKLTYNLESDGEATNKMLTHQHRVTTVSIQALTDAFFLRCKMHGTLPKVSP